MCIHLITEQHNQTGSSSLYGRVTAIEAMRSNCIEFVLLNHTPGVTTLYLVIPFAGPRYLVLPYCVYISLLMTTLYILDTTK